MDGLKFNGNDFNNQASRILNRETHLFRELHYHYDYTAHWRQKRDLLSETNSLTIFKEITGRIFFPNILQKATCKHFVHQWIKTAWSIHKKRYRIATLFCIWLLERPVPWGSGLFWEAMIADTTWPKKYSHMTIPQNHRVGKYSCSYTQISFGAESFQSIFTWKLFENITGF